MRGQLISVSTAFISYFVNFNWLKSHWHGLDMAKIPWSSSRKVIFLRDYLKGRLKIEYPCTAWSSMLRAWFGVKRCPKRPAKHNWQAPVHRAMFASIPKTFCF